jgi:hypothetical protein
MAVHPFLKVVFAKLNLSVLRVNRYSNFNYAGDILPSGASPFDEFCATAFPSILQ